MYILSYVNRTGTHELARFEDKEFALETIQAFLKYNNYKFNYELDYGICFVSTTRPHGRFAELILRKQYE